MRISAPPIRHPCHYGVDMSTTQEMVAHGRTEEEIATELGCDSLRYLSLEGVYEAIRSTRETHCDACFSGDYPLERTESANGKYALEELAGRKELGTCVTSRSGPRRTAGCGVTVTSPMDLRPALHEHFGFAGFRPGQREACEAALADRDVMVVMPTGSGKSLCYQLPALLRDDLTVVVSPLVALMQDQVEALAARGLGDRWRS